MICAVKWGSSGGRESTNSKELRRIMMNRGHGIYVSDKDSKLLRPRYFCWCHWSVLLGCLFLPVYVQARTTLSLYFLKIYEKSIPWVAKFLVFPPFLSFFFPFSMALQLFGPSPLFQFFNPIHSRQNSLYGDQPVTRPLPTHRITQI
jgi:hypothetical protein